MKKDDIKKKAALSWTKEDYEITKEEAPECVYFGKTEGEIMDGEALNEWLADQTKTLSIIHDDNPIKFEELYQGYLSDLEYLFSLGKITPEELDKLKDKEIFNLEQ